MIPRSASPTRSEESPGSQPFVGVLGGMGPLATADFLAKLVSATPAARDQDHLSTIVYSDPTTPDRTAAILGHGPSPLPSLLRGIAFLNEAECALIAIPCNTAHYWYTEMQAASRVPIIHIVDALVESLRGVNPRPPRVGLLATTGTLASRIYHQRLEAVGVEALDLSHLDDDNPAMRGITAVKAGQVSRARGLFREAARELRALGAECIALACTEVSGVLDPTVPLEELPVRDASEALAAAIVMRMAKPPSGVDPGNEPRG